MRLIYIFCERLENFLKPCGVLRQVTSDSMYHYNIIDSSRIAEIQDKCEIVGYDEQYQLHCPLNAPHYLQCFGLLSSFTVVSTGTFPSFPFFRFRNQKFVKRLLLIIKNPLLIEIASQTPANNGSWGKWRMWKKRTILGMVQRIITKTIKSITMTQTFSQRSIYAGTVWSCSWR